ncbi:PLP-dependent transferase [Didymella exigua CBS 183.55]|uniref:PLP-dependent transferase n=1 Tax=Didymella exigua CBS 183.55 TaxID=1150837 RepID=A0A6A5RM05_9PLEO|nr:PLP-dependent transferase [Didymella exigua CBS 183.55]KAF1928024.1 PLP-dependent transferase [Didymella exigua CBS 183.55]
MSKVPAGLWKKFIAVQVYGANTDVGKTVFSSLLGKRFKFGQVNSKKWQVQYIKPVSTGPQSDRDDAYVRRHSGCSAVHTLFQFQNPVSPHIAAREIAQHARDIPNDDYVNARLSQKLCENAFALQLESGDYGLGIVETAGGVLSPGPSGTPQADIYRSLRLPVVLVGDHKLGGIAATISAAESLKMRGYDIDAVVCFDDKGKYQNAEYLKTYLKDNMELPVYTIPWIPHLVGTSTQLEQELMMEYYNETSRHSEVEGVAQRIVDRHAARIENMDSMASRTQQKIWHPFTQHKHVEKAEDVLVFDSAHGDFFQVKRTARSDPKSTEDTSPILYPAFDGSASWWTQGLGHGNPRLAVEAAYAAGRYGHIMFAGATHEPALKLAEHVLRGLQNPRLTKVFYTDDGSTATEVGIKMGVRAACKHYDWDGSKEAIGVLGLKGSYHGDTIGAMDASEPCVFNEKVDWYRGRGYWFDYPTFKLKEDRWVVEPPEGMDKEFGPTRFFAEQDDIFDFKARGRSHHYEAYIEKTLNKLVKEQGRKFGVLVMEPVILGAGGMIFVDPLFQQSLARVVRRYNFATSEVAPAPIEGEYAWSGLPVMFDEVFTGLYRLGQFSSAFFLEVHPDISVHAKLLTGGLLPLSITAASDSIFQAFWGDEKSEALLHGHSYTAHPIGSHVANVSLKTMDGYYNGSKWQSFKSDWKVNKEASPPGMKETDGVHTPCKVIPSMRDSDTARIKFWSFWSKEFVFNLSRHERVDHVNALGSVLAVSLKDQSGAGYTSSAAVGLRDALLFEHSKIQIHSRILGNVIYLMASLTSTGSDLHTVEEAFLQRLDAMD